MASSYKKVCVVIPTFNRVDVSIKCVTALSAIDKNLPIIICDSNSADGTPESVSKFNNVTVLSALDNWWTGACNLGIEYALSRKFELIILLNDDVDFNSDLIDLLILKHSEYPESIISPSQDTPSGTFLGHKYHGVFKSQDLISHSSSDLLVDTTNGCCLLIPSIVFNSVGLLDAKNCPHLYGDTVFQLLAKRAGFNTYAIPTIRIRQHGSTDYLSRIRLNSIFTSPGSPFHLKAFIRFGDVLFNGRLQFNLFGMNYSLSFLVTLLRTLPNLIFRS